MSVQAVLENALWMMLQTAIGLYLQKLICPRSRKHYQLNNTVECTTVISLKLSDIPGLLPMSTVQLQTCDKLFIVFAYHNHFRCFQAR
jgi:hypothetical protein